ncbi:MAG: ribonuclease D [Candidatus Latescibacteria bacterium]|nr:ribonuclease D [Candidatus Latescibacterota bacterium]
MTVPPLIDSAPVLHELITRAHDCTAVALDTEFVWERTYAPHLGVVQLALGPDDCHLIDAVALPSLEPLGQLLADAKVVKILHDAPQDLTILQRATGAEPRTIFDTRTAAGFGGLESTLSLGNLLLELSDVVLIKDEQRSNWLARPLSPKQATYAAADVAHLHRARELLLQRAAPHRAWLEDEMARFDEPGYCADPDPSVYYKRIKKGRSLPPPGQAVLRALATWRETQAQRRDRPRGHIIPDNILALIARCRPATADELEQIDGLSPRAAQRYGGTLLQLVAQAQASDPDSWPQPAGTAADFETLESRTNQTLKAIRSHAEELGIDPALVTPRAGVQQLITQGKDALDSDHLLLQGWRREFLGDDLLELLIGQEPLRLVSRRRSRGPRRRNRSS